MLITLIIQNGPKHYGKRVTLDSIETRKLVRKGMKLHELLGIINNTIRDIQYAAINKIGKDLEKDMNKKIGYWEVEKG